jgi:thiopurine S-methyltransferase
MDREFWTARWKNHEIGFHRAEVNPLVAEHWQALGIPPNSGVLVPLCGKSLDLRWLRQRGHRVIGVELSAIAAREFFAEAGETPMCSELPPFEVHETGGIRLLVGDFFDLERRHLEGVEAAYDRAALIALPPELRVRYAKRLSELLPERASLLVVTFEYVAGTMEGPPFSVPEEEVRALYEPAFQVTLLHRGEAEPAAPRALAKGLESARETVYALRR